MKPKKLSKKLSLNKKSISNLNNFEMNAIDGGVFTNIPEDTCNTCNPCGSIEFSLCGYNTCPLGICDIE